MQPAPSKGETSIVSNEELFRNSLVKIDSVLGLTAVGTHCLANLLFYVLGWLLMLWLFLIGLAFVRSRKDIVLHTQLFYSFLSYKSIITAIQTIADTVPLSSFFALFLAPHQKF